MGQASQSAGRVRHRHAANEFWKIFSFPASPTAFAFWRGESWRVCRVVCGKYLNFASELNRREKVSPRNQNYFYCGRTAASYRSYGRRSAWKNPSNNGGPNSSRVILTDCEVAFVVVEPVFFEKFSSSSLAILRGKNKKRIVPSGYWTEPHLGHGCWVMITGINTNDELLTQSWLFYWFFCFFFTYKITTG